VRLGREAANVAGLAKDQRGRDNAEAADVLDLARLLGQHRSDARLHRLELRVQLLDVGDVLQGELLACLRDLLTRPDRRQQLACLLRCEAPGSPTRLQFLQQLVQPVDRLDSLFDELLTPVGQQLEHCHDVVGLDQFQVLAAQAGDRDRIGIETSRHVRGLGSLSHPAAARARRS
jgi:hypothetical protein